MNDYEPRKGFWYWVVCLGVPGLAGFLWWWMTPIITTYPLSEFREGIAPTVLGVFFGFVVGFIKLPERIRIWSGLLVIFKLLGLNVIVFMIYWFLLFKVASLTQIDICGRYVLAIVAIIALFLPLFNGAQMLLFCNLRKLTTRSIGRWLLLFGGIVYSELLAIGFWLWAYNNSIRSGEIFWAFYFVMAFAVVIWYRCFQVERFAAEKGCALQEKSIIEAGQLRAATAADGAR